MREVEITKNDHDQRLDRFLRKYLSEASKGFIYKMIRKKNILINGKRAKPEDMIYEGDKIQLYLSEETLDKFIGRPKKVYSKLKPSIVYEDENIIIINKEVGVLSHGSGGEFEDNIVDSMVSYLIGTGDYVPRVEKTFTPSICNRLDRNTSGLIIGAKNYETLKQVNDNIKNRNIKRFYKTIVSGQLKKNQNLIAYLSKDEDRNRVTIRDEEFEGSKEIETNIRSIEAKNGYSILEIELITGRTHQIRGHLSSIGYPIIGDRKYGNKSVNEAMNKKFALDNQFLHAYRLVFNGMEDNLSYLNSKEFTVDFQGVFKEIEEELFR